VLQCVAVCCSVLQCESLTLSVALSENLYRTHFFSLPLPPSLPFSPSLSQAVAGLLQVDENEVRQSMCNRLITAGTDVMVKPETMEKASQARDALGKVCVGRREGAKEGERQCVCVCAWLMRPVMLWARCVWGGERERKRERDSVCAFVRG